MNIDLYLQYYDYNDGAFDVDGNYYRSEEDYINAVSNEYNKNKDVVFNTVMDAKEGRGGLVVGADGQTYSFGQKASQNEDKVAYSRCGGIMFDAEGSRESVDSLITHFAKQEQFVEMIEFDEESSEEEFYTEFAMWIREHNGINEYIDIKGEEWCWLNEPRKDLYIHFKNNGDEDVYAVLEGCKVLDVVDGKTVIVFIDKMRIIDNFLQNN